MEDCADARGRQQCWPLPAVVRAGQVLQYEVLPDGVGLVVGLVVTDTLLVLLLGLLVAGSKDA